MGTFNVDKINETLKATQFITDNLKYGLYKLDKSAYLEVVKVCEQIDSNEYVEIINDKRELSLVVRTEIWDKYFEGKFQKLDSLEPLAIITCDVAETFTGYLLALVSVLSPNNISVYVQGAFTTDHVFVDTYNLEKALNLLNKLKQQGYSLN
jgi:hypothetical protein